MLRDARPEVELLVHCARTELDAETSNRIKVFVGQDIDWEYLLELARQHGVTPLLHKQLTAITESAVPDTTRKLLQNAFQRNVEQNLYRTSELHRLLARFDDRDIRVIPFKGPVLAENVYGSVSFREFRDLDLLVSEQDVPKATTLLRTEGYTINKRAHPDTLTDVVHGRTVVQAPPEFDFYRARDASEVDLRWQLRRDGRPFDLSFNTLWKRRQQAVLAGKPVQTLSREDRMIVLADHGAGHLWRRLEWVCDVAEMLRADEDIE